MSCKRSKLEVKGQGHRGKKNVLTQIGSFRTVTPVWIYRWLRNDAQSFKYVRRGSLLFFKVIWQIARSHSYNNHPFLPELGISKLWLKFEFIDGYEMLHKTWSVIQEVPNFFSRSSIKFPRHMLQFEFTDGLQMVYNAWCSIEEVPDCFWRSSVKFLGHAALKITNFDPNWVFPDCNSSLNSLIALKWCTILDVV